MASTEKISILKKYHLRMVITQVKVLSHFLNNNKIGNNSLKAIKNILIVFIFLKLKHFFFGIFYIIQKKLLIKYVF